MFSLLIETCTERGCVAIMQDASKLFYHELPFGYQNSNYLIPTIEQGFKETGLEVKNLNFITLGVGPGSYTGIRVGAVVAKVFVFVQQIPVVQMSTLQAFLPSKVGPFTALIDAKIGGAYFINGFKHESDVEWTSSPQVLPLNELVPQLSENATLVSPHSLYLKQKMGRIFPDNQWKWEEIGPDPERMTMAALTKLQNGQYSLNGDLDLLYMRKTQAEIEKE